MFFTSENPILITLELLWFIWPVMFLGLLEGAIKGRGSVSHGLTRALRNSLVVWGIFAVIRFFLVSSGLSPTSLLPEPLFWAIGLVLIVLSIGIAGINILRSDGK